MRQEQKTGDDASNTGSGKEVSMSVKDLASDSSRRVRAVGNSRCCSVFVRQSREARDPQRRRRRQSADAYSWTEKLSKRIRRRRTYLKMLLQKQNSCGGGALAAVVADKRVTRARRRSVDAKLSTTRGRSSKRQAEASSRVFLKACRGSNCQDRSVRGHGVTPRAAAAASDATSKASTSG